MHHVSKNVTGHWLKFKPFKTGIQKNTHQHEKSHCPREVFPIAS